MSQDQPPTTIPPLRGFERAASWLAYHVVRHWPWNAAYGIMRPIFCALLPWAGRWAYAPDGGGL